MTDHLNTLPNDNDSDLSSVVKVPTLTMIWRETLLGKSLGRTLVNAAFSGISLNGSGIDLGAKNGSSSYYRFFNLGKETKILFSDLHSDSPNVLKIDLEQRIPVNDGSQDFLILANVLEHLYDYQTCVSECARVLKPGGCLVGCVPFLVQVHPDPDDFFRYTSSSLRRIFSEAGFTKIKIESLAFGSFSAATSLAAPMLRFKPLISLCSVLAVLIDRLAKRLFPKRVRSSSPYYPIQYFFLCYK